MKSLKELYKAGPGPSSSHTLGPQRAASLFMQDLQDVEYYEAHLYGSLSLTGKGHLTDYIIEKTFAPTTTRVIFQQEALNHPNTMILRAFKQERCVKEWTVYSIGGGAIEIEGQTIEGASGEEVYQQKNFEEIKDHCAKNRLSLLQYIEQHEDIDTYMHDIFDQMIHTVEEGLIATEVLPGRLQLQRSAKRLYEIANKMDQEERSKMLVSSYAYAAAEQNASGGITVTAPTLGASGVLPALMYYYYINKGIPKQKLVDSLKIGGLFGNIIKQNATISGAKGGCQAEIGAACSMGSAAVSFINDLPLEAIEYSAEMGMEHHLGLTCDPVGGYVMIPCIERNAVAALRSIDCAFLSKHLSGIKENRVTFDMVVNTMNYTGKKIAVELKETSLGGLASVVPLKK